MKEWPHLVSLALSEIQRHTWTILQMHQYDEYQMLTIVIHLCACKGNYEWKLYIVSHWHSQSCEVTCGQSCKCISMTITKCSRSSYISAHHILQPWEKGFIFCLWEEWQSLSTWTCEAFFHVGFPLELLFHPLSVECGTSLIHLGFPFRSSRRTTDWWSCDRFNALGVLSLYHWLIEFRFYNRLRHPFEALKPPDSQIPHCIMCRIRFVIELSAARLTIIPYIRKEENYQ